MTRRLRRPPPFVRSDTRTRALPPSRLISTRGTPIPSFRRSTSAPIATPTADPTIAAARAILTHSAGRRDQIIIMGFLSVTTRAVERTVLRMPVALALHAGASDQQGGGHGEGHDHVRFDFQHHQPTSVSIDRMRPWRCCYGGRRENYR